MAQTGSVLYCDNLASGLVQVMIALTVNEYTGLVRTAVMYCAMEYSKNNRTVHAYLSQGKLKEDGI